MQLRRVLLLFALVLGLSALVASLVPAPGGDDGRERGEPPAAGSGSAAGDGPRSRELRFEVDPERERIPIRRAPIESGVAIRVAVPEPGDVELEGLGLRTSGDPLAPARFTLFAARRGRHDVVFHPVRGRALVVGRLILDEPGVRRQPRRL